MRKVAIITAPLLIREGSSTTFNGESKFLETQVCPLNTSPH